MNNVKAYIIAEVGVNHNGDVLIAKELVRKAKESGVACNNPDFKIEIGKEVLSIDPSYFRPTEVDLLIGDPTKAKEELGWTPEHDLSSLVKDMMQSDVKVMQKNLYLKKGGYQINNDD